MDSLLIPPYARPLFLTRPCSLQIIIRVRRDVTTRLVSVKGDCHFTVLSGFFSYISLYNQVTVTLKVTVTYRSKHALRSQRHTHLAKRNVLSHLQPRRSANEHIPRACKLLFVISKIKEYSESQGISVIAYCLMPTHYHLLCRQDGEKPAGNLPQLVFNGYSKAYNRMYSLSGTLFEGRFRAKVIQTTSHLLHLCRYIHGNPVKDGLVVEPVDWPCSNYLEWIGEHPDGLVERDFINDQFSTAEEYRKFLVEYLKTFHLPEDVQKHIKEIEK